jgi:hypothetical protein
MPKRYNITVRLSKETLLPETPIAEKAHHRAYWYIALILFGRAADRGDSPAKVYERIKTHLFKIRDECLGKNSWDSTIKTQLASAYKIAKSNKNNFYKMLDKNDPSAYTFTI